MFNIDETPIFTQTVKVIPPGGAVQDFSARFEALDIDAFSAFDLGNPEQCKAFLERVVINVDDIVGAEGQAVPDSPDLRGRLFNKSWVRNGLVAAYLAGHGAGLAGN